jgi:hypothetical protein
MISRVSQERKEFEVHAQDIGLVTRCQLWVGDKMCYCGMVSLRCDTSSEQGWTLDVSQARLHIDCISGSYLCQGSSPRPKKHCTCLGRSASSQSACAVCRPLLLALAVEKKRQIDRFNNGYQKDQSATKARCPPVKETQIVYRTLTQYGGRYVQPCQNLFSYCLHFVVVGI